MLPPLPRGERVGARELQTMQLIQNHGQNAVCVLQDITVPKSYDDGAHNLQLRRSIGVASNGGNVAVLSAVQLDDQAMLGANEVDDEAADRTLPLEFEAVQP